MAIASRTIHFICPSIFSGIQTLIFDFHRMNHKFSREDSESPHLREEHTVSREDSESYQLRKEPSSDVVDRTSWFCSIKARFFEPSKWKVLSSWRDFWVDNKKISWSAWAVLEMLSKKARILRGIRVAAHLGLSFSQETATAIDELYTSIEDLNKEMFSSMDNLFSCDQPSENALWVALLAFHLALVDNPQDALVIWAFSSVLYYGNFARKSAQNTVQFSPEILEACPTKSNEELAKEVADCLTIEQESLIQSMARHTNRPCGLSCEELDLAALTDWEQIT